ncbi:Rha family transcriptional regulator [uncultured Robinsoniella sp.]|uniref:Rha family transcriptional regulator n=1 Tax=uncultured Robinsoniella sp. TaxID=904190 RepID=UPI00374F27D4
MLVEIMKINKEEVTVVSSLDVAETFEKNHRDVMESIRNIETGISTAEFSALFNLASYRATNGKSNPMYQMTRDGFTLLVMGYTGEKAMKFKLAYIKQFNAMEKILRGKLIEREKGIAVRQSLTKALQQSAENERMHGHAYSTYTNAIYKTLFGKNANQLREEYGIGKKDNLRDSFSAEDLKAVQSMECLVSGLVDCGWGYDQIKQFIQQNHVGQLAG